MFLASLEYEHSQYQLQQKALDDLSMFLFLEFGCEFTHVADMLQDNPAVEKKAA